MSFVIHFNLRDFVNNINPGSTVYFAIYSLKDKPTGTVLLTSDAGVSGGAIRAIQMTITGENPDRLALATDAGVKIQAFLLRKGILVALGVFATSGLQDALKYWGVVPTFSLPELDLLSKASEEVSLNERR